ncbi:MAG: M16 family metallopeptidase, partial [Ardenticatenaceae bacterium]
PEHPLAHDVAGSRESIRGISREELLQYMAWGYTPERAVLSVAGPVTHSQVRDLSEPLLHDWSGADGVRPTPVAALEGPVACVTRRPIEQSHLVIGLRGPSRQEDARFAFSLLNTLLGDGMSSRLFTEIREERGLAYSIYSSATNFHDTGAFSIYAGVDSDNLHDTIQATLQQLHRLREEPVGDEELAMTKAYARGRTLLRLEDSGANASWVGGQLALTGEILTPDEVLARVDAVTTEEIQAVARRFFRDDQLVMSLVGPVAEEADWPSLLRVE